MLEEADSCLAEAAAMILAQAGSAMRMKAAETPTALDMAKGKLLDICRNGAPNAAKAAVR